MSSLLLKNLSKDSIITLIPGLSEVIFDLAEIIKVTPGQVVAKKGDILRHLLIPMSDDLILTFSQGQDRILQKGRSLALGATLEGIPLTYDVKSSGHNNVLAIDLQKFRAFMADKPEYLAYLKLLNQSAACRNLKNFLSDRNLNKDLIVKILYQLEPFEADVYSPKDHGSQMLLIDEGRVNCKSTSEKSHLLVDSTVTTGSWIGGCALLPPYDIFYKVSFLEKVRGWRLDPEIVREKLGNQFNIIEDLAYEPWLQIDRSETNVNLDHLKSLTEIKARVISPEEALSEFGIKLNTDEYFADNDLDAIPVVLNQYAKIIGQESNQESFRDTIYRFSGKLSPLRLATLFEIINVPSLSLETNAKVLAAAKQHFAFFLQNRLLICIGSKKNHLLCLDGVHGLILLPLNDQALEEVSTFLSLQPAMASSGREKLEKFNIQETVAQLIWKDRSKVIKILISSIPIFIFTAIIPMFTQIILDEVLVTNDRDTFFMAITGMIISLAGVIAFTYFKSIFSLELALSLDNKLTRFIYFNILKMKPSEVARLTVGGVLNRIDELEKVREFLSTETINIVIGFLSIAIYSVILLNFDFKIVSVPLGLMLLIVAVQLLLRKRIVNTSSQLFESGARLQTFISESVANSKTVKAFGAETVMATIWDKLLLDSIGKNQELVKLNSLLMVFVEFLTQLVQLSGIWIASMLLLEGKTNFTAGELFAVSLYLQRLVEPLLSIINFYFDYQSIKVSYDKISDIVRGAQEENEFGHAVRLKGKVKFDRVSFRYFQDGPWILRDLNFSIFPGQIVGIVGKSGSGKTTLASLIAGSFAPTTGKVFYDDYERSFISTKARLSQIGTIEQNNQLFSGSILSNIAFSDDIPERDMLNAACDLSYSNEFVNKFPQGLETFLAEGGLGLSGGQKQRLCIARTIYSNPKIMLFDEATSALDAESEKAISDNLRKILNGKTSFIIAHRLSTIKNADIILVLDQGKIVQQGNHEQLMKVEGTYRELFMEQAGQ